MEWQKCLSAEMHYIAIKFSCGIVDVSAIQDASS